MVLQRIELEEAQSKLGELADQAAGGGEIVLTRGGTPVAKIISAEVTASTKPEHLEPRQPGSAKGMVTIADDFDETPEDFAEYM